MRRFFSALGVIFMTATIVSAECKNVAIFVTNNSSYPLRLFTINALPADTVIATAVGVNPKSSASFEFKACDAWELTVKVSDQQKYQWIMSRSSSHLVYVSDEVIAKEYESYTYLPEDHPPDKADPDDE